MPLREVLEKLREDIGSSEGEEMSEDINNVLRRCFAPVALGLDALHTQLSNKR